jgi:hypothetical protein
MADAASFAMRWIAAAGAALIRAWVVLFGKRCDPHSLPWLAGPVGGPRLEMGPLAYRDIAAHQGWTVDEQQSDPGLVEDFTSLASPSFDPGRVHPELHRFYERTSEYDLEAWNHSPPGSSAAVVAGEHRQPRDAAARVPRDGARPGPGAGEPGAPLAGCPGASGVHRVDPPSSRGPGRTRSRGRPTRRRSFARLRRLDPVVGRPRVRRRRLLSRGRAFAHALAGPTVAHAARTLRAGRRRRWRDPLRPPRHGARDHGDADALQDHAASGGGSPRCLTDPILARHSVRSHRRPTVTSSPIALARGMTITPDTSRARRWYRRTCPRSRSRQDGRRSGRVRRDMRVSGAVAADPSPHRPPAARPLTHAAATPMQVRRALGDRERATGAARGWSRAVPLRASLAGRPSSRPSALRCHMLARIGWS